MAVSIGGCGVALGVAGAAGGGGTDSAGAADSGSGSGAGLGGASTADRGGGCSVFGSGVTEGVRLGCAGEDGGCSAFGGGATWVGAGCAAGGAGGGCGGLGSAGGGAVCGATSAGGAAGGVGVACGAGCGEGGRLGFGGALLGTDGPSFDPPWKTMSTEGGGSQLGWRGRSRTTTSSARMTSACSSSEMSRVESRRRPDRDGADGSRSVTKPATAKGFTAVRAFRCAVRLRRGRAPRNASATAPSPATLRVATPDQVRGRPAESRHRPFS
jgi:hypothetical protein